MMRRNRSGYRRRGRPIEVRKTLTVLPEVKELLKEKLHLVFTSAVLERGRSLYEDGAVLWVEKEDKQHFKAHVMGSDLYEASLLLDLKSLTYNCVCECPYALNCKHSAALALYLIQSDEEAVQTDRKGKKNLDGIRRRFGTGPSSQYRELPVIPPLTLEDTITCLSHGYLRHPVNRHEVTITDDDTLEIEAFHVNWQGYPDFRTKSAISVKIVEGKILIKCNVCGSKTKHLCEHQQAVLNNLHVQARILNLLSGKITYKEILSITADHFGLSTDIVAKNFNIRLDPDGVKAFPVNDEIILGSSFLPRLDRYLKQEQDGDDVADFLQQLEKDLNMANAFAWSRDNSLILLKGRLSKDRTTLASHIERAGNPIYWDDKDQLISLQLFEAFRSTSIRKRHRIIHQNRYHLGFLIHYFIPHTPGYSERIRKKDLIPFIFSDTLARLQIRVSEEKGFTKFEFSWIIGDETVQISEMSWHNDLLLGWQSEGFVIENPEAIELLEALDMKNQVLVLAKNKDLIKSILDKAKIAGSVEYADLKTRPLTGGRKELHLREVGNFIVFEPTVLYPEHRFPLYGQGSFLVPENQEKVEAEPEVISTFREEIRTMHPSWDKDYVPQGFMYLPVSEITGSTWFLSFIEKAAEANIEIFGQEKLSSVKFSLHRPSISMGIRSGVDWFEAKVNIAFGKQTVPQKDWIEFIKSNQKYIRLRDGSLGMLPEDWLKKLHKLVSVAEIGKDSLQVSKLRFNVVHELFDKIDDQKVKKEIAEKKKAFESYNENKKYRLPTRLKTTLRPYQVQGFQWLKFLDEFNFGGCLADDMGLGKTLQVIAFLLDQKKNARGTNLVVIPKSLLFNWSAEIDKFGSELTYLIHHGQTRDSRLKKWRTYDVILSTYDTIARDATELKKIAFNYIILDESQAIKNPNSVRYKSLRLLKARNRLAMTGTPIENNTFDLYAQMSFLNPGLLGSIKHFKDQFSIPIDNLGDETASVTLRSMIHPFLLRRTKEQVAKDLPEKTETILYCEMEAEQRKIYDEMRAQIREEVTSKISEGGVNKAKFMILEGLLRLRQVCNATELVDDKLPPKKRQSVKIEVLLEQIREELGQHKALVFSQFVSMLTLIKKALDKEGIKYAYLDGSTRDRKQAVRDFMEDDDCHLFLISLKAGNTGLNLVKADYVYIVDPWWNPAVEAQAIDRTHRIGQTRNIFAYRLICKDTIEEKIVQLQQKKKKLAGDLIQTDEHVFKALNKDELLSLFG
jgi:superfamily II DNA or RNA helicase